jgi:ribonuclease R
MGALGGNFWVDEHRTKATGLRGSVVLTIGDAVEVEITAVDEDLRRTSAWLTEAKAQDERGKTFTFAPILAAPAKLGEGDFEKSRVGRSASRVGGERSRRAESPQGRPPRKVRRATGGAAKPHGPRAEASPRPPKGSVRGVGKRKGK